jgi:glutamyl/glutaminyl-tRNA synthetase
MAHRGGLILRNEDLDRARCKPEFVSAMYEDLAWFGFQWQEGPDCSGPFAPYSQSERVPRYRSTFEQLKASGAIYPCSCSRQDVLRALGAPHAGEDEPSYPGTCRPAKPSTFNFQPSTKINWRFLVPDGETISFIDGNLGPQEYVAGKDFGDFVLWRHDDVPSYQLAVVVDDAAMKITEVVRGEDLLKSTARQILLYRALNLAPPQFYHCPLLTDESGVRLAKRYDALSLRSLRSTGASPSELRARFSA